ncbi:hypothetical protein GCM10020229_64590 [Kitasatospora albolonga]
MASGGLREWRLRLEERRLNHLPGWKAAQTRLQRLRAGLSMKACALLNTGDEARRDAAGSRRLF